MSLQFSNFIATPPGLLIEGYHGKDKQIRKHTTEKAAQKPEQGIAYLSARSNNLACQKPCHMIATCAVSNVVEIAARGSENGKL